MIVEELMPGNYKSFSYTGEMQVAILLQIIN